MIDDSPLPTREDNLNTNSEISMALNFTILKGQAFVKSYNV